MATGLRVWALFAGIFLTIIPGVLCDQYNIGGLVAAAAVSIFLLAVVIGMVAAGLSWNRWYPQLKWAKGKVKMPRAYWRKKEEAKLRLLHGSRSGLASLAAPSETGLPNGNTTSRVRDTGSFNASWVQGWNNAHASPLDDGGYEEMALAMDLGEEREEEVRIETTVVDNEPLDLGPYRDVDTNTPADNTLANGAALATGGGGGGGVSAIGVAAASDSARPVEMNEEPDDSYVYSTVDRSSKKSAARVDGGDPMPPAEEEPAATSEKVTSFSKMDPYLVAL